MYGIKVPLTVDDYVWVIDGTKSSLFELNPLLFKTKQEAQQYAKIWGDLAQVLEYCSELV